MNNGEQSAPQMTFFCRKDNGWITVFLQVPNDPFVFNHYIYIFK